VALASFRRIKFFSAESLHELFSVGRLAETIDMKPLLVMKKSMASRAQRQIAM
jgi:hypothetical protein